MFTHLDLCCSRYRLSLCTPFFIRNQIRSHALAILGSTILAISGAISDSICISLPSHRCVFSTVPLGAWLRFSAFALFISPPCRLVDRLIFTLLAEAGGILARHSETLSTAFFYVSAVEDSLGHLIWLFLIYIYVLGTSTIPGVVGFYQSNTDSGSFVEKLLETILLYQILSVLRNLTVRVATRSLLISSFESKTADTIFSVYVLLGLSLPHWVKNTNDTRSESLLLKAGKTGGSFEGLDAKAAINEFIDMSLLNESQDLRRRLDAVSSLTLLMYSSSGTNFNEPGRVIPVLTKEELARLSSATFRDLHSIPKEHLPVVVLESEEITGEDGSTTGSSSQRRGSTDIAVMMHRPQSFLNSSSVSQMLSSNAGLGSQQPQSQPTIQSQSPRNTMVSQLSFRRPSLRGRSTSLFPGGVENMAGGGVSEVTIQEEDVSGTILENFMNNDSRDDHKLSPLVLDAVSIPPLKLQRGGRANGTDRPRLTDETFVGLETATSAVSDPWKAKGSLSLSLPLSSQTNEHDEGQGFEVAPCVSQLPSSSVASSTVASSTVASSTHLSSTLKPSSSFASLSAAHSTDISGKFNAGVSNFSSIGAQVGKDLGKLARQFLDLAAEDSKKVSAFNNGEDRTSGNVSSRNSPVLCIRHFAAAMDLSGENLERAFSLFDRDGIGEITLQVFLDQAGKIMDDLSALKASLDGSNQSAVAAVSSLVNVCFLIFLCFGIIFLFELNPASVIVPIGTLIVSCSFAIGPTVANVISSIILVLVTRPYDVGDRIYASDILEGKELLLVQRIELLSTTFTRTNNRLLTAPNFKLLSMNIENLRRSPNVVAKLEFSVPFETGARQLENVRLRLDHYIKANTNEWRPGSERIRVVGIDGPSMKLIVFVTSRVMWSEVSRLFKMNHSLLLHVCTSLTHEGIRFKSPDLRVLIDGSKVIDRTN
jgi:small-conductance mechanosensitive channel